MSEPARFKVVWTDGYDRDAIAQRAVLEDLAEVEAECRCEILRAGSTWEGDWWVVLPQDSTLWRGMEDLV